jgi:hypothetical protein
MECRRFDTSCHEKDFKLLPHRELGEPYSLQNSQVAVFVATKTGLIRSSPMEELSHLFENNRRWVAQVTAQDPGFFQRLSGQQTPKYLWIGCADSRVPANEIVGLLPGELLSITRFRFLFAVKIKLCDNSTERITSTTSSS